MHYLCAATVANHWGSERSLQENAHRRLSHPRLPLVFMGASRIGEEQDGVKTAKAPGTRGGGFLVGDTELEPMTSSV